MERILIGCWLSSYSREPRLTTNEPESKVDISNFHSRRRKRSSSCEEDAYLEMPLRSAWSMHLLAVYFMFFQGLIIATKLQTLVGEPDRYFGDE